MNRTPIEWTHWSVNPFKMQMPDGTLINVCSHKSVGCRFCYAEGIVRRWWKKEWGEFPCYTAALLKLGTPVLVEEELKAVLRLSKRIAQGKASQEENKIFWNDMTDEYLEFWPDEFIDQCWAVRSLTPNLIHQILTKRPDRMLTYFSDPYHMNRARTWSHVYDLQRTLREAAATWPLANAHIGVSVEDQKTADERIPLLLQTLAAVRWISAEPLLGPVNLRGVKCIGAGYVDALEGRGHDGSRADDSLYPSIDWVVVGGESGPKARPMHPDWARSLRDQCVAAKVPYFFKQWGEYDHGVQGDCEHCSSDGAQGPVAKMVSSRVDVWRCNVCNRLHGESNDQPFDFAKTGKKAAGRLLDGVEWHQFPETRP